MSEPRITNEWERRYGGTILPPVPPPTFWTATRNLLLVGLPMFALIVLQWPFKAVSDALGRSIDSLHDRAERILGPKK